MSNFLLQQKPYLQKIIQELLTDFPYVSILATDVTGTIYETQLTETKVADSGWTERGFVVRIHNGFNYSEFSFNQIPENPDQAGKIGEDIRLGLKKSLEDLKNKAIPKNKYPIIEEKAENLSWQADVAIAPEETEPKQIIARLMDLKTRAQQQSALLIDMQVIFEQVQVSKIFLSAKKDLAQAYIWSQGYLIPIVRREDNTKYTYQSFSGLKGVELIRDMEAGLNAAVTEAESLLDAGRVEPGEYDVICSPSVAGLIAHEAFGHGVEMDMFVKKRAKATEYLGKPIASELVSMHDGARAAQQVSSYFFDDEGTLGKDTLIIDKGILKNGISDLLSAFQLQTTPTGNGKRESYERKAYSRMTNTFFAKGRDTIADMIASISFGYLLEKFASGMEDPRNWGIQCMIHYAREIKEGRLTGKLVSPVILTGYVPDLLKSVSMVSGDEIRLSGSGACGKGYKERVKVSAGGPYIKTKARLG